MRSPATTSNRTNAIAAFEALPPGTPSSGCAPSYRDDQSLIRSGVLSVNSTASGSERPSQSR